MLKTFLITKALGVIYIKEKYNESEYLCIEWDNIIEVNSKLNTDFCAIYEELELLELIALQDNLVNKLNIQIENKEKEKVEKEIEENKELIRLEPLSHYLKNFTWVNKERIKKTLTIKEFYSNDKGGKSVKARFEKIIEKKASNYIIKENRLIKDGIYTTITKTEILFFNSL